MKARDIVEILDVYNYNGIEINIGNKNSCDFRPAGTTTWLNCQKNEVIQKLSYMGDNEELFGVPKYFILDCIKKTEGK